ncbi:hypothetical protein BDV96DRAFT_566541 [Lophiotrema nucula]|uniref:Uncharacterized protein n=1 Tax=Lophiotrema nucula TaxID=690887 RepID=A0A6A5ZP57_9PLEO|nr:hypothetical protein BDV96DRAFT_566541 [Lophiotrema nucula]
MPPSIFRRPYIFYAAVYNFRRPYVHAVAHIFTAYTFHAAVYTSFSPLSPYLSYRSPSSFFLPLLLWLAAHVTQSALIPVHLRLHVTCQAY